MAIPSGLVFDVSTLLDEQHCTRPAIRSLSPQQDGLRRQLRDWRQGNPFSFYRLPFVDDTRAIQERATRITREQVFVPRQIGQALGLSAARQAALQQSAELAARSVHATSPFKNGASRSRNVSRARCTRDFTAFSEMPRTSPISS